MSIGAATARRFAADLDALLAPGERVGIAVSGGPDSLALLIMAAGARPGLVRAATVDHALRAGSRAEAEAVAAMCATMGVAHDLLTVTWSAPPMSAVQERARAKRYALLGDWATGAGLAGIATGHHADDQAETLLMRLGRGAGVRGLAAMRASAPVPGRGSVRLLRPLLGWRRAELGAIVAEAGHGAADDPSNHDPHHERVRLRAAIAASAWIDAAALARSAAHLAEADAAIDYAVEQAWRGVEQAEGRWSFAPGELPVELRRRLVMRVIARIGHEGDVDELRGREVDRMIEALEKGDTATLRGVRASGGATWVFSRSPARR